MVRHSVFRWAIAILALSWGGAASAGPMGTDVSPLFQTGDVEKDFNASSKSVTVIPGQSLDAVAQPEWLTQAGRTNGFDMKDIRLSYDKQTDTLAVGVNFWGIAGNTDGSPEGKQDPRIFPGGQNQPHIGGDKSITVAFSSAATPAQAGVVAGVPADKSASPAGSLDSFKVSTSNGSTFLGGSYGTTLTDHLGALAYDPTKDHPDFEFTIKNFSTIPNLNALTKGFYIQAYTGAASTYTIGKSFVQNTFVGPPLSEPGYIQNPPNVIPPTPGPMITPKVTTPEPTTILAWGLVAGGAAWRVRRRIHPSIRP